MRKNSDNKESKGGENKDATKQADDKQESDAEAQAADADRAEIKALRAEVEELREYKAEREEDDAHRIAAEKQRGLTIRERDQHQGGMVTPGKRLWLTADKKRLVKEGHRDAAVLYCSATSRVPRAEYERLTAR